MGGGGQQVVGGRSDVGRTGAGGLAALLTIVAVFGVLRPAATASADRSAEGGMDARKPDRKPQLYQMLAYNDRIDTQNDELRMDFSLRVAHGLGNPECGAGGANRVSGADKCGLNILYRSDGCCLS
ncbi:hypothetical protein CRD59_07750 [Bifidobacterium xylocopae]|uniref:Uncharacterized protein n=1 Tax=Bifidobacterium xylocopae TaxID=2493119 RepID=A0A366KBX9_9BIFI|nr:hypothetical protein CRD59_07750 [Bifidobacterium xylocopae]